MYTSHLDLAAHVRKDSDALLQARLTDALDLEAQTKQAHWNVRGPGFIQLHEFFDSLHAQAEDFADTLAERIAALGGLADGRVQTTAAASNLTEYSLRTHSGEEHLRALGSALGAFGKAVRGDIETAAGLGDAVTADVFTEIARKTDKMLWLVEAHYVPG
jgi:starvation-inducible DNA-binding protein